VEIYFKYHSVVLAAIIQNGNMPNEVQGEQALTLRFRIQAIFDCVLGIKLKYYFIVLPYRHPHVFSPFWLRLFILTSYEVVSRQYQELSIIIIEL
jgi:hypothetical protein